MVGRCFVAVGQSVQKLRPKHSFIFGISGLELPVTAAHELEGFYILNLVNLRGMDVRGCWQSFRAIGVRNLWAAY